MSDCTPWRELTARGSGWGLTARDPAASKATIEEYANLDEARNLPHARAREFPVRRDGDETTWPTTCSRYRARAPNERLW